MPALVMISEGKETRYDLASRPVVVGRSVECDIQVSEERASRRHFLVEPTERGWVVRDLDSSNGTAVNGYGISRVLLTNGDLVEVGGLAFRFETEAGGPAVPRTPRPERKGPSSGPAWVGAIVAGLSVAVVGDILATESAGARDREVRDLEGRVSHAEFVNATRESDPEKAESLLGEHLKAHPASGDAAQARARLVAMRNSRETRKAASAEFDELKGAAPTLSVEEYRWRLEQLVRRWADTPDGMAEIRRRAQELKGPEPPAEDTRVLFQRRKRDADAAMAAGDFGRALAIWNAHALECPPASPGAEADIRAEMRRVEDGAAARTEEVFAQAVALRDQGKGEQALKSLRAEIPRLEGTAGGRRLADRVEGGFGSGGTRGVGPGTAGGEGFARKSVFYHRAKDAEQFVALHDYRGAAGLYASISADAAGLPDVHAEMEARIGWLRRVADMMDSLRTLNSGWKGKPWPETWDLVPAEDLGAALAKTARKPEDRLTVAAFAYDQGLKKLAQESVCAALGNDATHAEAEKLYALREGIPVPEGGFVAEKGEIITRGEWNRRRNAEAIVKLRERQTSILRHLRESQLVRSLDRMRAIRAELDKARTYALDLIFDEAKYFYPYRDRMGEYAPVQLEVDKRVEAVRKVWDDKTKLRAKPDSGVVQMLKEFDEAAKQLRGFGSEPAAEEKEVEDLRRYFDRDLDVRTYFVDAADLALQEYNQGVLRENEKRKSVADEAERKQVEVTNEYRIMFGRRALLIADKLVLSARAHCDDMCKGGFFDHFNQKLLNMKPGEKVPKQACGCSSDALIPGCTHGPDARMKAQGYEFVACSENIEEGAGDPEGAHRGWIHSSGHHRNILHTAWKEMGTGRVGKYWDQNFGLPPGEESSSEGAGSAPWDRAGGRGTGEDGNPPEGK